MEAWFVDGGMIMVPSMWCGCDFGQKPSATAPAATTPAGVVFLLGAPVTSPIPGLHVKILNRYPLRRVVVDLVMKQ
jgi:hypothetical protein